MFLKLSHSLQSPIVQRKLGDVRSDSKADQSSLDAMEVYEKQAIGKSKSILDLDYSMSSLASQ